MVLCRPHGITILGLLIALAIPAMIAAVVGPENSTQVFRMHKPSQQQQR